MRRSATRIILVAACCSVSVAEARPTPRSAARAHHRTGQAAYRAGNYEQAVAAFQAGYALDPRPAFLLNIAQTYRHAGRLEEALDYYRRYLALEPNSPLRSQVEDLEQRLATVLRSDRKQPPNTKQEPASPMRVARTRRVAPDALGAPPASIAATATPPAPSDEPTPLYRKWWFWAAVTAAVGAGVGVGLYFGTHSEGPREANLGTIRW